MCTSGLIILKLILEVGLPQWENPKQIRRCMDGSSVGNQKFTNVYHRMKEDK